MNLNDEEYYEWLKEQIEIPGNRSYDDLLGRMHSLEFIWTIPGDGNRVQDGLDLRTEYFNGYRPSRFMKGVSILEVLIALSRRLEFVADGDSRVWAWKLIKNLRLNKASDPFTQARADRVEEILYSLVWRTYEPSGLGGFFPLRHALEDQTQVEIWYQMQAYVTEMQET